MEIRKNQCGSRKEGACDLARSREGSERSCLRRLTISPRKSPGSSEFFGFCSATPRPIFSHGKLDGDLPQGRPEQAGAARISAPGRLVLRIVLYATGRRRRLTSAT